MSKTKRKSDRLLQWFGSNTDNAAEVGVMLRDCRFVAIPFCGGCSEVPHITAKQILANDLHRHLINLCEAIKDDSGRKWIVEHADAEPYHPDVLARAQEAAKNWNWDSWYPDKASLPAALWYFITVWMGRGGKAGTTGEFTGALPIRWNANGGGSNRRYRTAIEALDAWGETFRRCEFTCMDAFDFLAKCQDTAETGIYCDANWPDAGDDYLHNIDQAGQCKLAGVLRRFDHARESNGWVWHPLESRNQANDIKPEFLIVRNGA